jgi:hypothetical protein
MSGQQEDLSHSRSSEPIGPQGHSGAELPNREHYAPNIPLMTDFYTHGSNIVALEGMIKGLICGAGTFQDDSATDDMIKLHVLPKAKKNVEALATAIKDYERRTFKAPKVTAEQYEAMTRAERLGSTS